MLSLFKVTPEMGANYFSKEDYYSQEEGPAKPEFYGKGCELLGIKSQFNQLTFQKLLEGMSSKNDSLRIIKPQKFEEKGKKSFTYTCNTFLKDIEKNEIKLTKNDLNQALSRVLKYSNIQIKDNKNKQKILQAIDEHPISGEYSKTKKNQLIKTLMIEICEHGALNGSEITTLPEYYLAYEHEKFGKIAHKLIDRHFFLNSREDRHMDGYNLYFNALKKYYPDIANNIDDYQSSAYSKKKLATLINQVPVIGLWNDENIFKLSQLPNPDFNPKSETERNKFISVRSEQLRIEGNFSIEALNKISEEASVLYPIKNQFIDKKEKLSFDNFCKKYSLNKEHIEEVTTNKIKNIDLKFHLNFFQAKKLKIILNNQTEGENNKKDKIIQKFVASISKKSDRSGLDLTFSAPKSVSLIALIGGDKQLLNAHKKAVKFTLKHIENNYIGARFGSKTNRQFSKTGNLTASLFYHGTSREKDPQLHTHCVLINTTCDSNGKWKAIHNDKIFSDRNLLGAIYRKKYADLIRKIGYEIIPGKNGTFEIEGFNKTQLKIFSKRSEQINDILDQHQMSKTSKSKAQAVLMGRKVKQNIDAKKLMEKWKKEADLVTLKMPLKKENLPKYSINWKFATEHIQEKNSIWSNEKLLQETIHANINKGSIETILKSYEAKSEVKIVNSMGKKIGLTNNKIIQTEEKILKYMKKGRSSFPAIATNFDSTSLCEKRGFTKGQNEAFKLAITSKDLISAWVGVAGSGKSYALKDVRKIAEEHKHQVIGLGPDGNTANELSKTTGIKALTIDKFLLKKTKKGTHNQLWIVDEAGKISSHKMLQLIDKAIDCENTRILLIGDTRQIGAVNAGSPFTLLINNHVLKAELTEHRRQKNSSLKNIVEMASKKEFIAKSVIALNENTIQLKTRKARMNKVIKIYSNLSPTQKNNSLILTDLNQDRLDLTYMIREDLKKSGNIGKDDIFLKILRSKDISDAQKKHYWSYNEKDIIVPFKDIIGTQLKKNFQYMIDKIDHKAGKITLTRNGLTTTINPKKDAGFSIYQQDTIQVSKGDKLQFTKNYDGKTNRENVSIKKVENNFIYFNEIKDPININLNHHLDHSLVQTTYGSQGQTCDHVIFLAESRVSTETWYVGISRAKESVNIITDNQQKLSSRVLKSQRKFNALDFEIGTEPLPSITSQQEKNISYEVSL